MGEDRSRSRNPNLLANLALIRSSLLQVISEQVQNKSLPALRETLAACSRRCLQLLANL